MLSNNLLTQNQLMRNYYRFQSKIYDATRWSFLFGRSEVLQLIPFDTPPEHIVEIGCGTGHNLDLLNKQFPGKTITGIDVSDDMLRIARKKMAHYSNVRLWESAYSTGPSRFAKAPDLILFSYALTMINPQWKNIILQAQRDLRPGGKIAVVDFHSTSVNWFRKHMANNHVRMEGHLDPLLELSFDTIRFDVKPAYLGLWNYFLFIGEKRS